MFIVSNSDTWQPFYNLYSTDVKTDDFGHDCFYSTITTNVDLYENIYVVEQIVEYCIRTPSKEIIVVNEKAISSKLTFDELKKNNITSTNLMEWSSPIDLIERYEYFLQMNTSSSTEVFYNCTLPWFGSFCQYRFVLNQSFSSFIQMRINEPKLFDKNMTLTCYMHMKCDLHSFLTCLDWREICDGKVNCLDGGEDEKYCVELEMNQCEENEYQCQNGMCVNEEFLLDEDISQINIVSPECLDGSDEVRYKGVILCARDSSFRCEDVLCPQYTDFSCGNGDCRCLNGPRALSGCTNSRDRAINYLFYWDNPMNTRYSRCFKTLMCVTHLLSRVDFAKYCKNLCNNTQECKIQTIKDCPPAFIAPTFTVWDDHVRFGYFSNETSIRILGFQPDFVCYSKDRCPFLISTFTLDNHTCLHTNRPNLALTDTVYDIFRTCNQYSQNDNESICRDPTTVRCLGTNRCIPKRRIMDGFADCPDAFDESIAANSCALNDKYRFQCTSESKCLSPILVNDQKAQCIGGEDETFIDHSVTNIHQFPFSSFCNNWTDIVSNTNETDETHCEQWPCVNQYTLCNKVWNCEKGIDEINCSSSFQCPANHHPCLSPNSRKMDCLHINRIEDGIIDCLGSTDERSYCRSEHPENVWARYRCSNDTKCVLPRTACQYCDEFNDFNHVCDEFNDKFQDIIQYLSSIEDVGIFRRQPFSHKSSRNFPPVQSSIPIHKQTQNGIIKIEKISTIKHHNDPRLWLCNKGFVILVGKNETEQCLCPESYYGDQCQYQNQRVGLTIRLRQENLNKLNVIGIIIRLVDHTGFVHSYEQITYKSVINCNTKYNMHLLYQNRPKDMTKNYTIYIDAYYKINLIYLTSWIFPVKFLFMPVNRMSVQLRIPTKQNCHLLCSDKYLKSLTNDNTQSCRCSNWINSISTLQNRCNCALDSICVGFKENRSICLCHLNKTGPRCYLNSICQMKNICMNNGICVPHDSQQSSNNFTCVCPNGFSGELCEKTDVRIDISFSNVETPQSLLVHFINVISHRDSSDETEPIQVTMFKKILFNQKTITFNMSLPFHLVFVEFEHMYYLIVLQHYYTSSAVISTQISPSQRCPHIQEVLDEVIVEYPHLRRVKYYHTICQHRSDLTCFHDNYIFMCLCTEERHANCFHFNFNMTYNCLGQNDCQNDGRCFQDHPHCPTKIMCVCQECFYGDKCQFTTKHSGLSLDSILGYHIYPHLSLSQQPSPVQISIAFGTLILIIGVISGILSNLTFQVKSTQKTGCGLYLFTSSITSILVVIFFYIKLWILISSQMNTITGRSFLLFNCISIEFILRFLLATTDWLHAFVTIEQFFVAFLGINFDKAKSRQFAKRIICMIFILTAASILHDPIHRRLIDDIDEERTWCLVKFTSKVETYNRFINIFHFIIPFSFNVISVIGIIIITARQRSSAQRNFTFRQQLKLRFHRHKHLILSSILLIILELPRLIISFLPNCMKSPKEYKLFLALLCYLIFLLIFIIFGSQYLLFFHKSSSSSSLPPCVCRNHLNEPVDWFIIYKLPRLSHSVDPNVANGTGYIYLDSSSSLDKWRFSSESIDTPSSLTGLTLGPLYKFKEYSFLFYNDQPPNIPISLVFGHSKGVVAFDDSTQTGFWLVHSVPRFPPPIVQGYGYPDSGRVFGQTMLCMTLNTSTSLPINSIDLLSTHFMFTRPLVFNSSLTSSAINRYPILSNSIITNKGHITEPPYTRFYPLNISSIEIHTFSKYGLSNIDMLSELIVPTLGTSMLSETWSNGRQINLSSNCTGQYHTENIEKLSFNFTVHHDHSKWLVSNDDSWVCIGDMNRQAEQKVRHGGFACINDKRIQQRFRQLVSEIEPCPKKKK
ncbi:unnamed protein product [Adineta steineri]|uniref:Uncharacterized protein n=1 Tax=Adineta steineri TaxID=433720 RepID=A0A818GXW1_9BILA|nr:unnamed protein product [Adineta steineri]CAF3497937.1 unnamed protein product [Adineta steineri]